MPEETDAKRVKKGRENDTPRPGQFVLRSLVLLALTLLFYWVGWRSPWARADQTVRVEVADPPKPVAVPVAPPVSQPEASPVDQRSADREDTRASSDRDRSDDEPSRRGTRHRRTRARREGRRESADDATLD